MWQVFFEFRRLRLLRVPAPASSSSSGANVFFEFRRQRLLRVSALSLSSSSPSECRLPLQVPTSSSGRGVFPNFRRLPQFPASSPISGVSSSGPFFNSRRLSRVSAFSRDSRRLCRIPASSPRSGLLSMGAHRSIPFPSRFRFRRVSLISSSLDVRNPSTIRASFDI